MKAAIRDRFVLGHIVPSDADDGGAPLLASLGHTPCSSHDCRDRLLDRKVLSLTPAHSGS
jgi:hypothetical protein